MAEIITVEDLPESMQTAELIVTMVAGANAKASRVAPCLVKPTTEWDDATAYAVGDTVLLAAGPSLEATVAGTSAATAPTAPTVIDDTVVDGSVTWKLIAPTADQLAEAKLVLIGAISRWVEAGSGALQSQTAGPFGITMDTRQKPSGYNLWPSEIEGLQEICTSGTDSSSGAFSIRPSGSCSAHMPWCSLMLGANYCSCGADLTDGEYPLYEGGVLTTGDEY